MLFAAEAVGLWAAVLCCGIRIARCWLLERGEKEARPRSLKQQLAVQCRSKLNDRQQKINCSIPITAAY